MGSQVRAVSVAQVCDGGGIRPRLRSKPCDILQFHLESPLCGTHERGVSLRPEPVDAGEA
jgi:hypothetical protein